MVTWMNSRKSSLKVFSGFIISLLVVTLVFSLNTRVALADDYEVNFYSANQNPVSGQFVSATKYGESIDSAYEYTIGKYGYVDYLISYKVVYSFSGFVTGNSYKYRPYGQLLLRLPSTPNLTGFVYDQVFIDSYSWNGIISDLEVTSSVTSNAAVYNRPVNLYFRFDWIEVAGSSVSIDLNFRVRLYCNEPSAVNLYTLGQTTISSQLLADQPTYVASFNQVGIWIANFILYEGYANQFNNSGLITGYLYDIRNALVQEPDTDYTAALDSAQSALDTEQDARDDVFQQVDQFYMTDADSLLTLDDIDSNIGVGLDFWFDWVNAYFNKAEEVDANKPLTLNIIFNFISRLF